MTQGLKRLGWILVSAIVIHIILIVLSILEVFVFSLINPGEPNPFYRAHAEVSGPIVSIVAGFPIFILAGKFLARKLANKLNVALLLPILYTITDFLIVDAAGVIWEQHLMIFMASAAVKMLGTLIGVYVPLGQKSAVKKR